MPFKVLRIISLERTRGLPNETGGFLIGMRRGPHIEVTELTTQGPGDRATPSTFARLCPSHRDHIHAAWRRSGAVETMVGDWHSHPTSSSVPSRTDHSAWRALVRSTGLPMIGLIDAGAPTPSVFLSVDRRRSVGTELPLRERDADTLVFGS